MAPQKGTETPIDDMKQGKDGNDVVQADSEIDSMDRDSNPYAVASFLSKLFFKWPQKLLEKGMTRAIEESDLPDIMNTEKSEYNRNQFEKIWNDEVHRVETLRNNLSASPRRKHIDLQPSLQKAIVKDFLRTTWIVQPLMFASSTARIVMSVALGYLIQSFIDKSKDGYMWASILVICNAVVLFEHHHVFFITWRKGMQLRIGAVASIFAKSLRLNSIGGSGSISTGQIMTLVSNDVERFMQATLFASYVIWAPLQAIAILVIGLHLIGPAFAIGIGLLLFVFIPLQFYLSKHFALLRSKVASITDQRMTLVSQAIGGVRVVKMSGWENELEERIASVRASEVKKIHRANLLKALNEVIFFSVNVVISIVIFISHVYLFDGTLTTRNVFTIMSLMNVLQIELTKHLSLGVMSGSECWVSIRRVQKFLESPELRNVKHIDFDSDDSHDTEEVMRLCDVTCHWDSERTEGRDEEMVPSKSIALSNVNLSLRKSDLLCVTGPVGSGKSALLYALAGELSPTKGKIQRFYHSLAYASQDPWIMNGTIRSNILMGRKLNNNYYNEVVRACGLLQDFKQFVDGDLTIVGDRGVQCSGGQKARIGLARALYCDSEVLLLDDPLSAVDTKVGRQIFYSAIQDLAVKRGKCVVLATHQHQYVGKYRCAFMLNGQLKHIGLFEECVAKSGGMLHLVSNNDDDGGVISNLEYHPRDQDILSNEKYDENDQLNPIGVCSDQKETKAQGVVTKETFMHYAKSTGSSLSAFLLLLLFIFTQIIQLVSIAVLGRWSEYSPSEQKSQFMLVIVLSLGCGLCFFSFVRSVASFALTLKASKKLHDAMTSAVLRARIQFFDTNPSGRILNRFSADVGSNDDLLPHTLFDFFMCAFLVGGSIITAVTAIPFILVIMPPLVWYFLRVRRMFVTTSRELKRIEGLARSPIYAKLNESICGIATIRSNDAFDYIKKKFQECHDAHSRAFWSFLASSRWLGFRMDYLMFLNVSLACFIAVLFSELDWFGIDPVIFGLALSMLIQLGSMFQWTIRQSAEVVNQMVCVERVSEYSKLEPEAALSLSADRLRPSWPNTGCISVRNVSARYRNSLPLSLKNISFDVPSGKSLGIVGRTGSGKSTLVQVLLRIIEAEQGTITIDGIDVKTLGLHKLRKSVSVINQIPILFSGRTVRENLDPFYRFSDEDIIHALTDVQMIDPINALPRGMNSQVAESGSNFSTGERQLLCLARAILEKRKILILDEPTANVDSRTDKLLQAAVKKSFSEATIISVAHRLNTIIENDLILVLGRGEVLEFGSPAELILRNGHFSSMIDDTGREMSMQLREKALAKN